MRVIAPEKLPLNSTSQSCAGIPGRCVATTGNAVGGIIAYSLALGPNLGRRGTYALIPESDHPPLRQRMALIKGAGETAKCFYRFLQEPRAREVFRRYGFTLPGEG